MFVNLRRVFVSLPILGAETHAVKVRSVRIGMHHYFELVFINEAAPGREAVAPIFQRKSTL